MRAFVLGVVVSVLIVTGLVNAAAQLAATVASVSRPSNEWSNDVEELEDHVELTRFPGVCPLADEPYRSTGWRSGLAREDLAL